MPSRSLERVGVPQRDEVKVSCESYLRTQAPPPALAAGIGSLGRGVRSPKRKVFFQSFRCSAVYIRSNFDLQAGRNANRPLSSWQETR